MKILLTAVAFIALEAQAGFVLSGPWTVDVTDGANAGTFAVEAPRRIEVAEEFHARLPVFDKRKPVWKQGERLCGIRAEECSIRFALDPSSVRLRLADGGAELARGVDWELNGEYGTIGWVSKEKDRGAVLVSYSFRERRIDAIVRRADGMLALVKGKGHVANPAVPPCAGGETLIGTIYVDAQTSRLTEENLFPVEPDAVLPAPASGKRPERTLAKLRAGEKVKILAWGDSVTDGFWLERAQRWQEQFAAWLQREYPDAQIELVTNGWPEKKSESFLRAGPQSPRNFERSVLELQPDLVVSEFVNDASGGKKIVEEVYSGKILPAFRERGIEWVILTPHWTSAGLMGAGDLRSGDDPRAFVKALREFAKRQDVALADASLLWGALARRGIPYQTLLANGVNHPDAAGMSLFAEALKPVFADSSKAPSAHDFQSPQGAARENTGPLFWMHGDESEARLREYVGRVAESGQGVLTIESRPHTDWMREGWWRDVDIVLDECRKRGLKAMIYDDYWWPSQGMGGKYPIPGKFQCRDVKATVYANDDLPAGKIENEIARVKVEEVREGVFSITPEGGKTIVYSWFTSNGGYRFATVNGLDEEAVDWFIAQYYQPYCERYAKEFQDGTIVGFFFDEPEFRSWWGEALAKELESRGDDAGELLTALKFKLADPQLHASARYRYLDARAETWGRTMYGRLSAWCREHGVFSSGHFLEHSTCHYNRSQAAGNVLQQMKYVDVPGVDLVCGQYYPNHRETPRYQIACGQIPKYASSSAHVYNRHGGLNWCEIFGAYGQGLTYPQMKWFCDWHQYQGCYRLIPHSFNPRAPYDGDCPPYFYNGGKEPRFALFRVWADYNNRSAMMLSGGEHVCHIAQCIPGISYHVGKTIRPEMFSFAIQDAQLDSDWMLYDAIESARIEKNPRTGRTALRTENGREHYDILSLPATECIPFAVLEKALAFAKAGGVVVGYGIKPCNTPTRGKTAEDAKRITDEIFSLPTALFIDGEPDGATLRAALAQSYPGENRPLAVREFDFEGLSSEDGRMLAVNHYVKGGAETLFVANQDIVRRRELSLSAKWPLDKVELWDSMQGTVEKPVVDGGCVKLSLEPCEAVFLVWPESSTATPPARVKMPDGTPIASSVTETATPIGEDGDRENTPPVELDWAKWIWHPVDPKAQGKVVFTTKIDSADADDAEIVFCCDNAATVCVNGKEVAKQDAGRNSRAWEKPTRAKFRLAAGTNDIEVHAENVQPGPAGFVSSLKWSAGSFLTNAQFWKVRREGESDVRPLEICRFGRGAWRAPRPVSKVTLSPYTESVATELAFTLPELKPGERVYFACDDVEGEKSAAVEVNGAFAGGFIGSPYRLDITKAVKSGENTLEAKPFRVKNPRIIVVKTTSNKESKGGQQ